MRPVACRCSAAMAGSYRRVTIPNKQGLELAGILEEAGKWKGEEEVCILCHGFRSSKDSSTLSSLSKALVEAGISTFRFDFQGNGESQGEFAYGNYWREVEDLRAVIEYWKAQGRRVETIIGHSKGGNCVVLYASKYHDVPNIVNISGRFSLDAGVMTRLGGQEGLQKLEKDGFLDIKDGAGNVEYRVTKESLEDRLSTDMNAACLAIPKECHVLTIHGAKDEVVPVEDAYKFSQKISTHSLSILDNANHGYRSHQHDLAQCVLDFVKDG